MRRSGLQKGKKSRRSLILAALAAVLLLGAVFRHELSILPAVLLVRADPVAPDAPFVALLMGDNTAARVRTALELWQAAPTARLLLVREEPNGFAREGLAPDGTELHLRYLRQHGVPPEALVVPPDCVATSTTDEARCLASFLSRMEPKPSRLVVVTSWYHTSRAGWIFDRILGAAGVSVAMVPAYGGERDQPERWWQSEAPFLSVFNEYLKWTFWLIKGLT